jgi:pimeloyl-ACP methyl ester carboxylesterase
MPSVLANGTRLNVVTLDAEGPPAPTVVLVHGLIMDNLSSFYYTLGPRLRRLADVVLYDLRGHGRSERPAAGYRVEDAVDDLVGLLDALGHTEPVHLVGNSYGGTIVLAAARERPDRVASVVSIEGLPAIEGWSDTLVSDLEDIVAGFDDPSTRRWLDHDAGRKLRRMARTCEALIRRTSMPADFRESAVLWPADVGLVRCPVLLLYGEYSELLGQARWLDQHLPDSRLEVVHDTSHALLMEEPELVERHVAEWIAGQAAP